MNQPECLARRLINDIGRVHGIDAQVSEADLDLLCGQQPLRRTQHQMCDSGGSNTDDEARQGPDRPGERKRYGRHRAEEHEDPAPVAQRPAQGG